MKADWTELMFLQKRVGDTSLYVFFFAILCVSSRSRRSSRAGPCRWR